MQAMVLNHPKEPLKLVELPIPEPGVGQVLIKILACGICRTDLHVYDGELPHPKLPLILGHQVVGLIVKLGKDVKQRCIGERVGCPWLDFSCQSCFYCLSGQENLCDASLYRGYQLNGGFAEYCLAHEEYVFSIPERFSAEHAAPLLCAGLIGFRAYCMAQPAEKIGLYGFGAAAHILIQIARHEGKEVYAFTKKGDVVKQSFAKQLGARWAGSSEELPPELLDSAIIFASDGDLVPQALRALRKGGTVICAGIYMSDIPSFPYEWLYGERGIRSVTNLTRQNGIDFFKLVENMPIRTNVTTYPLKDANQALSDLKHGNISGSGVILP